MDIETFNKEAPLLKEAASNSGLVDYFPKKSYATDIIESIMKVQPMTAPLAGIFYLKYRYSSGPKLVQGWLFDE